jgi:hypothetical protein
MNPMSESDPTQPPKPLGMNNKERVESARSRIERAMAELMESGSLPIGVEARLFALQKLVGGSHGTYYRNRELWHPVDLAAATAQEEEEECCLDRLEIPPTSEENPVERIGRKSMQSGLTDVVYEVMPQWKIDESQSKSSVLIPQLRPQINPPISPLVPQGRPRIDRRPPMPWPKWGIVTNSPRLTPISPVPADQTPQNPVCYTLPMPIAFKPCSDRFQESEAVQPKHLLFAFPAVLPVPLFQPVDQQSLPLVFPALAVPQPVQPGDVHTPQVLY